MALVCRDPMSGEAHSTSIYREAYQKLMQLRAESGCSLPSHRGDRCPWTIDALRYANVRSWGQHAFSRIRAPSGPCPRGLSKVRPEHHSVTLVESPTGWGVSVAGLIARWPHFLPPDYHITPFNKEYDVCTYYFSLRPWIRDEVCSAVSVRCHGDKMSTAYLLRHIAVSMVCALREKIVGLSNLDIFKLLLHVHMQQLVVTGYDPDEKNIFVKVLWEDASLM
ncbi:hypothetical protein EYR40_008248 [Pleurotus pulmonarius]|nr:hypothetical protein EYR36_009070 [Pleurotus pulmonarius]KAF4597781.1 hypothetical protein EYR40_008248 [Pleurotus pulmonarius]